MQTKQNTSVDQIWLKDTSAVLFYIYNQLKIGQR